MIHNDSSLYQKITYYEEETQIPVLCTLATERETPRSFDAFVVLRHLGKAAPYSAYVN